MCGVQFLQTQLTSLYMVESSIFPSVNTRFEEVALSCVSLSSWFPSLDLACVGQSPRPSQPTPRKGFICFRLHFETTKNMNQVLARNGKEARRWPCKEHVIFCLHSAAWGLAPFTASFQDGLPAPPDSPTDATLPQSCRGRDL